MLNKTCTRTAKTRAIPSLHRDSFLAKVPGHNPDAASGNTTSPYCRAVMCHSSPTQQPVCFREFIARLEYSASLRKPWLDTLQDLPWQINFAHLPGLRHLSIFVRHDRLAPTLLAYGNSRFCIFKFTKPDYEHHLQVFHSTQALSLPIYWDFKKLRHLTALKKTLLSDL